MTRTHTVHTEVTVSTEFANRILGGSYHCTVVAFVQEFHSPCNSRSQHLDEQVAHKNVLVLQMKAEQDILRARQPGFVPISY